MGRTRPDLSACTISIFICTSLKKMYMLFFVVFVFWHFEINLKLIDQIFVKKLFKSQLSFNSKLISCTFHMVVGFTTSANPVQGEVYSIQHYVIKFQ